LFFCALINLTGYKAIDTKYFVFEEPKLAIDRMMADDINAKFSPSNSVMAYESHVRGYLNTLYNRGIYEGRDIEAAVQKATEKGRRYAVMLRSDSGYVYVDTHSDELFEAKLENGSVITTKFSGNQELIGKGKD
jgi:hypothetical protein